MEPVLVRAGFARLMDGGTFARLVRERDLGFVSLRVRSPAVGGSMAVGEAALERLAAARPLKRAEVRGEDVDGQERSLTIGSFRGGIAQHLVWLPGRVDVTAALVDALTRLPGFGFACVGDAEDDFWQSQTMIEHYEQAGRPHAHLPKVPGGEFPGEDEQIDIRGNWGRGVEAGWVWLWATSTMWFGPAVYDLIDRERLLRSPVGDVVELNDDVVRVELFPYDWYRANVDGMRERQRRFWGWMGYAELEARSDEILDVLASAEALPLSQPSIGTPAEIVTDALEAAEWIAHALSQSGYPADFSPASLREVDRFFDEHVERPGVAKANGLLDKDLGSRVFAIGAYVGEVIRRNAPNTWSWAPAPGAPDDEIGLSLIRDHDGGRLWPIQRVMKRYAEGDENGIAIYAHAFAHIDML